MRTDVPSVVLIAGLLMGSGWARARQPAGGSAIAAIHQSAAEPQRAYETAQQVLAALEDADGGLRTFTSGIIYTTIADLGGALTRRTGEIAFAQEPRAGGAPARRFAVRFDTLLVGDRYFEDERALQTVAFDGRWFSEKLPGEKQVNRYEVVREGDTADPFELGDGPFPPLPIGQRSQDILRRYDVRLVPATQSLEPDGDLDPEDPLDRVEIGLARGLMRFTEGSVQLLLVPRRASEDTRFAEIRLWYKADGGGRLLPRMSRTVDASSQNVSIVQLMHPLEVNAPPREDLLTVQAPEGWSVSETRLPPPAPAQRTPGPETDAPTGDRERP